MISPDKASDYMRSIVGGEALLRRLRAEVSFSGTVDSHLPSAEWVEVSWTVHNEVDAPLLQVRNLNYEIVEMLEEQHSTGYTK
jgi:hypothetical protein